MLRISVIRHIQPMKPASCPDDIIWRACSSDIHPPAAEAEPVPSERVQPMAQNLTDGNK